MISTILKTGSLALAALLLAACMPTQPRQGSTQAYPQPYASRCENCGTVERIDTVWGRDTSLGGGTILGAVIGGLAGSQVGSGSGRKAAVAAGAVAGGVVGHRVEQNRRGEQSYYQFQVRLDDGRWAEVTQLDNPGLRIGDRVTIRNDRVGPLR